MSTFQFDLSASLRNQSVTKIVTRTRCDTKIHTPWESYWSTALQRITVVNYAQPVRSSRPRFISFWSSQMSCFVAPELSQTGFISFWSSQMSYFVASELSQKEFIPFWSSQMSCFVAQSSPKRDLYHSAAHRCRVLSHKSNHFHGLIVYYITVFFFRSVFA